MKEEKVIVEPNYNEKSNEELVKIIEENDNLLSKKLKKDKKVTAVLNVGEIGFLASQIACVIKGHTKLSLGFCAGCISLGILQIATGLVFKKFNDNISAQRVKINNVLLKRAIAELEQAQKDAQALTGDDAKCIENENDEVSDIESQC